MGPNGWLVAVCWVAVSVTANSRYSPWSELLGVYVDVVAPDIAVNVPVLVSDSSHWYVTGQDVSAGRFRLPVRTSPGSAVPAIEGARAKNVLS